MNWTVPRVVGLKADPAVGTAIEKINLSGIIIFAMRGEPPKLPHTRYKKLYYLQLKMQMRPTSELKEKAERKIPYFMWNERRGDETAIYKIYGNYLTFGWRCRWGRRRS